MLDEGKKRESECVTWNSARSAGEKDWLLASKTPTVERAEPLPVMPYTDDRYNNRSIHREQTTDIDHRPQLAS